MTEKMLLGIAVVGAAVWLIHSLPFAFFRGHLSYYTAKVIPCAAFLLYFLVRFIREP